MVFYKWSPMGQQGKSPTPSDQFQTTALHSCIRGIPNGILDQQGSSHLHTRFAEPWALDKARPGLLAHPQSRHKCAPTPRCSPLGIYGLLFCCGLGPRPWKGETDFPAPLTELVFSFCKLCSWPCSCPQKTGVCLSQPEKLELHCNILGS